MLFTLEALQAKHGDSLILHYGAPGRPRLVVIDGGPAGVYRTNLRPRLKQLKDARYSGDPLPLQLLMVSHIDDDHIHGVLDLTDDLLARQEHGQPPPYDIRALWHNSFDDILGNRDDEILGTLRASAASRGVAAGVHLSQPAASVVASVGQGRDLRGHAARLGLPVNAPFSRLVVAPVNGAETVALGDGLKLTVLGPGRDQIERLHARWEEEVRRIKQKGLATAEAAPLAAAYADESVYNLSSIVVLAEAKGRRMLLTGDARGDDILAGLRAAGLLKGGRLHVDLLKLPHHGSDRNVETDFFRRITADRYVVSGNGEHGNPEIATLEMISEARGQAEFALYLTNRDGKNNLGRRLRDFFAAEKSRGRKYKVVFRKDAALSLKVDLLEPVEY